MRSRNNYSGLEPEIVKQLKFHAWRLKQMKCFLSQEIEDIEQDLLLEIWPALSKFDRSKSSLATFVDKLLTRRSNNLIHKQMCIKRGGKTQTLSLDQEDEDGQTIMDYLADDHCFEDEISIRIDVSKAIDQLPESFQALCKQLKVFTIMGSIAHERTLKSHHLQGLRAHAADVFSHVCLHQKVRTIFSPMRNITTIPRRTVCKI